MKGKISIGDTGAVMISAPVQMRDFEIAELFGVMIPTIRSNIHTILKSGVATADLTNGATLVGYNVVPDYHGLNMIMALAFRIQSPQAEIFRKWILSKATEKKQNANYRIFVDINPKTLN